MNTFVSSHDVVRATKAGIAAMNVRLPNVENTMTSLTISAFSQLQSKPLVCMASPLPLF